MEYDGPTMPASAAATPWTQKPAPPLSPLREAINNINLTKDCMSDTRYILRDVCDALGIQEEPYPNDTLSKTLASIEPVTLLDQLTHAINELRTVQAELTRLGHRVAKLTA